MRYPSPRATTTGYANRSMNGVAIHARSHHGARDRSKRAPNPFGMLFQPSSLTPTFSRSGIAIVDHPTSHGQSAKQRGVTCESVDVERCRRQPQHSQGGAQAGDEHEKAHRAMV